MTHSAGWAAVLHAATRGPVDDREPLLDAALTLGRDVATDVVCCSLTVEGRTGWVTPHASQALAVALDAAQYESGTGPCIEAASTGLGQRLDVIEEDRRFVHFAEVASEHGVLSSLSLPLPLTPQRSALNIYATSEHAFADRASNRVADLLARVIAALSGAPVLIAPMRTAELAAARQQGALVRAAVGVTAGLDGSSPDEAYLALATRSRESRCSIVEVAHQVLDDRPERVDG